MNKMTMVQKDLREMTLLWADHFYWTRMFIIETVSGYDGVSATEYRLFRNQEDLGTNLSKFYGKDTGGRYQTLLHDHIQIGLEIITVMKKGFPFNHLVGKWEISGMVIGNFLHSLNPRFTKKEILEEYFQKHVETTLDEITSIVRKDYAESIVASDTALVHVNKMVDYIITNLIHQLQS